MDTKESNNYYDIPKLNTFLSDKEIKSLDKLNKVSNKIRDYDSDNKDIMNLTIKEFLNRWANNNIDIFSDVVLFFSNLKNYHTYFNDIDNTGNLTHGFMKIISDFINIFKIKNRSIYFGITLVLISLLIYFIQITS